jgi:hypothetical protein
MLVRNDVLKALERMSIWRCKIFIVIVSLQRGAVYSASVRSLAISLAGWFQR